MFSSAVDLIVAVLGFLALLKFPVFLLPYARRRAALDRAYGDRTSATRTSDRVLLAITILLLVSMIVRGADGSSFLAGLWIGATLIQVYFHRFDQPLSPGTAPPPQVSPIKMMSYAIQASPGRAWRELVLLTVAILWSLALIGRSHSGGL